MKKLKSDFPIFANNPGLVYLDNAASTQKPKSVID
jgi:cysteine desulfurase/selenocysteine lyase